MGEDVRQGDTRTLLNMLIDMQVEAMGSLRLRGAGSFAFRRISEPLLVPVGVEATDYAVPDGFFQQGGQGFETTSFYLVNPNNCWVRLRGWSGVGDFAKVTPTTGWLFCPGFQGAFGTQYPVKMSAMAISKQGVSIPGQLEPLELIYGAGM